MPEILHGPVDSPAYASLWKVHIRKLCYFLNAEDMIDFVRAAMVNRLQIIALNSEFHHFYAEAFTPYTRTSLGRTAQRPRVWSS